MDYRQFMKLIEPGTTSEKDSIALLQEFVNEFPYFQSAQILLAKSMHEKQHVRYEKQLKIAAAYAGDRKSLYNLIHSKGGKEITEQKKHVPEFSKVFVEPVKEEENIFIDREEHLVLPPVDDETENITLSETPFDSFSSPAIFHETNENFEEENEVVNDFPAEDPHEIIRKRLNEILGLKQEARQDHPSEKTLEASHELEENIATESEKFIPEFHNANIIESEKSELETTDEVEKAQMESALEVSLIQSLEKLPVIQRKSDETEISKEEILEEEVQHANSFYDWLKIKSTGEFGKVEEVHAYTTTDYAETTDYAKTTETTETTDYADGVDSTEKADDADRVFDEKTVDKTSEIDDAKEPETKKKASEANLLIDRFIQTEPKIVPSKTEFYSPINQAKRSVTENEDIVSETLARIYFQQGNLLKARSSYQRLSLLYPEKLAYFAALILEVDQAINNLDKQDL